MGNTHGAEVAIQVGAGITTVGNADDIFIVYGLVTLDSTASDTVRIAGRQSVPLPDATFIVKTSTVTTDFGAQGIRFPGGLQLVVTGTGSYAISFDRVGRNYGVSKN